ncbi:hypothetical protein L7F22_015295 [Adiantum nelumboides]|nr:hypothetical protein [Adiantum nelumboides]
MFGHGPRDLHAPEEFHRQEQSFMMQGRYNQDPPPYLHQFPPQYEASAFNHYPPSQGPPFWPHDSPPPPPPDGHPPAFSSFYPPQHEYSAGRYPPGPPPSHSAEYPPRYSPRSLPFGEHMQPHQGHTQRQISFEADDRSSDPHSGAYPPNYAPHSSSFGEHMQPQQGHTQPYIYSFDAHSRSSEFAHVSSFGEQDGCRSVDAVDHVSHRNSSFPHHTRAIEVDKPSIVQREAAVADEISPPVNVELPNGQLVRVFCKHDRSFNLAVKDNRVLMVEMDTEDEFQVCISF